MTLDAITLSVIQAALQQTCDEMDLTFSRAAFSPVIAEANDRSDGIYSAVDGSLIAQGSQGLPVFVGTTMYLFNPTYFDVMVDQRIGNYMLVGAVGLILFGHLFIQRILKSVV